MSKTGSKTSLQSKGSVNKAQAPATSNKPGSRNGLLPQLTTIKYTIDIDAIKCPLCLEVFKSPRVLTCGHSLCFVCLETLILYTESTKTKDYFQCPVCRRNTKPRNTKILRQKWATQFPVNTALVRLLRNASIKHPADSSPHKAFCEICLANNTTRPVVSHCKTCAEHYCDTCTRYHEKREDARDHEMVFYVPKEEIERAEAKRNEWVVKSSIGEIDRSQMDKRSKVGQGSRDTRKGQQESVTVAQTITMLDVLNDKHVTKLGGFSGKTPGDVGTSDFRGGTFLSDEKVVLSDISNKKIKVFDVSHKTRVELICDMQLRVDPTHVCRVDASTVAVLTERSGNYHIRLFTIREKIMHFVHRSVDDVPLGIGFIKNTIVCSFLGSNILNKYRLSRAQQIKLGSIKHDTSGNDLFRHPGVMCQGEFHGSPALFVADETDFGITVTCISLNGERKSSVFLECETNKPKTSSAKRSNGVVKSGKSARAKSGRSVAKKEDVSDTTVTAESEAEKTEHISKQTTEKPPSQSRERTSERLSGRHTFRKVNDYGRQMPDRKGVKEIERPSLGDTFKKEITIDLSKLTDEVYESVEKSSRSKILSKDGKAVERIERAKKKPIGKVVPQLTKDSEQRKNSNSGPNSTITSTGTVNADSTVGTPPFLTPPKLVYRADSIAVDKDGNFYVCMASANKIIQLSPDGRVKSELLSEKDGIIAPKIICFSPCNDMFFVTCLKSNRVLMFRLK